MKAVRQDCRHCSVCDRNILDFTMMTDAEILEHLRENSGKICGKFRADQLSRPLRPVTARRYGLTTIAASVAAFLSIQSANAQATTTHITKERPPSLTGNSNALQKSFENPTNDTMRVISGRLLDAKSGEPLIGATIRFAQSKYGTISDWNGFFNLRVPLKDLENNPFEIQITYSGYVKKIIELPQQAIQNNLALIPSLTQMQPVERPIEFMGIISREKPRLEYRKTPLNHVRKFFHRLFR